MEIYQEQRAGRLLPRDSPPPGSHPSSPGPADPPDPPPSSKVERFLKLGYAHRDIHRVLLSLKPDAQTNDILEELIKTSPRTAAARPASLPAPAPSSTPRLVARGCSLADPGPRAPSPGAPSARKAPAKADQSGGFRPVVIDGSNVAMSHGNKKVFSCRGLQLAVMWFWGRGLRDITVFVPLWRKEQPRQDTPITDQHILEELEARRILVFTPSRRVSGRRVACYDDRYIVRLAVESDGIIVSNDNYRDLQTESPQWKRFIEERLLMYTFANDKFMPPDDPLGRSGPTIHSFLRNAPWEQEVKQQHCPYGKKCTYGSKCKFYHPERANQSQLSVADELRAMGRPTPAAAHRAPAGPEAELASPARSAHAHRQTRGPGGESSLDQAFGSMEGSGASELRLRSSDGLSSGYSSGYSGGSCSSSSSGFRSEPRGGGGVWGGLPVAPPPRGSSSAAAGGGVTKERRGLSSQLSALFPPRTVQEIMDTHPHVADMAQLISLIQRTTPLS